MAHNQRCDVSDPVSPPTPLHTTSVRRRGEFDQEDSSDSNERIISVDDTLHSGGPHPMCCSNILGLVPILVPVVGIVTMISTIVWSCLSRFNCQKRYPTLSYAATFQPQGSVFTLGMCITALLVLATITLYYRHLHIHLPFNYPQNQLLARAFVSTGAISVVFLITLAMFDMKNYYSIHNLSTVSFFLASWFTIFLCHTTRVLMQHIRPLSPELYFSQEQNLIVTKRCTSGTWFRCGRFCIYLGLISSISFAILFGSVNEIWPNPMGFSSREEAFAEFFSIVCQLLFVGSLWPEISQLNIPADTLYFQVDSLRTTA